MINFLKSDLFLMRKMKIVYILPLIFLLASLLTGFMYIKMNLAVLGMGDVYEITYPDEESSYSDMYADSLKSSFKAGFNSGAEIGGLETEEEEEEISFGKLLLSGGQFYEKPVEEFCDMLTSSSTTLLLCGLFSAFLFAIDIRGGFRKNITKINPNRWTAFFSKCLVVCIYDALFLVFTFITAIINMALFAQKLYFDPSGAFVVSMLVKYLILVGFSMFIALVAVFTKSTALSLIVDFILGLGVLDIVIMLIDLFFKFVVFKNSDFTFSLNDYLLTGLNASVYSGSADKVLIRAAIVSIVVIGLSTFYAGYLNQKRDIH